VRARAAGADTATSAAGGRTGHEQCSHSAPHNAAQHACSAAPSHLGASGRFAAPFTAPRPAPPAASLLLLPSKPSQA
jgi:hypothetical protein